MNAEAKRRDRAGRQVLAIFKQADFVMPRPDFIDLHAECYGDRRGWNGWLQPKGLSMSEQTMADLAVWGGRVSEIAEKLIKEQPDLHPLTAHVIAQDIMSAERATNEVNAGMEPTRAYVLVGSYARWDWVVTMVKAERIGWDWFIDNIAALWRGADPDDTNPEYLALWKTARGLKGAVIRDDRPLPRGKLLRVYRGVTTEAAARGIAWSLDPKIAQKFANGAGERVYRQGAVISGFVSRDAVLAYITMRGESEVIIDPGSVLDATIRRA